VFRKRVVGLDNASVHHLSSPDELLCTSWLHPANGGTREDQDQRTTHLSPPFNNNCLSHCPTAFAQPVQSVLGAHVCGPSTGAMPYAGESLEPHQLRLCYCPEVRVSIVRPPRLPRSSATTCGIRNPAIVPTHWRPVGEPPCHRFLHLAPNPDATVDEDAVPILVYGYGRRHSRCDARSRPATSECLADLGPLKTADGHNSWATNGIADARRHLGRVWLTCRKKATQDWASVAPSPECGGVDSCKVLGGRLVPMPTRKPLTIAQDQLHALHSGSGNCPRSCNGLPHVRIQLRAICR
jgi:hypothetical protein